MSDEDKVRLVRAALADWRTGELGDASCIYAIAAVIEPQPPITPADFSTASGLAEIIQRAADNFRRKHMPGF